MQNLSFGEPLVPLLSDEEFGPRMQKAAERAVKRSGRLPNSGRALANAGDLGAATREFFEDVWQLGKLPRELRLLIRYKVSSTNACLYCSTHQVSFLQKLGVAADKIAHIHESDTHEAFDERERVALAFAEAMTIDAANIPQSLATHLVRSFSPDERVEIAIVASAMGLLNKINDSLRIPLEDEVLDIAPTVEFRGPER